MALDEKPLQQVMTAVPLLVLQIRKLADSDGTV